MAMKAALVLTLVGIIVAQWPNYYQPDRIHGYLFVYHSYADLLVVNNSTTCILVDLADKHMEMQDLQTRYDIEDYIYVQIKSGKGEHRTTVQEVRIKYHDMKVVFECFKKKVLELPYTGP